jgi:hypothetical protein
MAGDDDDDGARSDPLEGSDLDAEGEEADDEYDSAFMQEQTSHTHSPGPEWHDDEGIDAEGEEYGEGEEEDDADGEEVDGQDDEVADAGFEEEADDDDADDGESDTSLDSEDNGWRESLGSRDDDEAEEKGSDSNRCVSVSPFHICDAIADSN